MLSQVITHGPISKRDIVAATGFAAHVVADALKRLQAAGSVVAEGATSSRRFRGAGHEAHSDHGKRTAAGKARNKAEADGRVQRIGLRERVHKAILADPDKLTEETLAWKFDLERELIVDATGELLKAAKIVLNGDGTYGRTVRAAA